jgi:hypothetical protein
MRNKLWIGIKALAVKAPEPECSLHIGALNLQIEFDISEEEFEHYTEVCCQLLEKISDL